MATITTGVLSSQVSIDQLDRVCSLFKLNFNFRGRSLWLPSQGQVSPPGPISHSQRARITQHHHLGYWDLPLWFSRWRRDISRGRATVINRSCIFFMHARSVVPDSLWPYGLEPTRLLCPFLCDFPGKNTGPSSRGSSPPRDLTWVSCIGRRILYHCCC